MIIIIWADGREEETNGEEIVQDGAFVRVLDKNGSRIRLIRREAGKAGLSSGQDKVTRERIEAAKSLHCQIEEAFD
jgi:hypothetical protein